MAGTSAEADTIRYRVTGMDCSSCAAKIEKATRELPGVDDVQVSITSQEMQLQVTDPAQVLPSVEQAVTQLGYQLDRIAPSSDDDDVIPIHVTPAYKRALWIVVLLNAGYGVIEIVGGYFAGSQSVKADALDFIGDGVISWLGLIAIGWGLAARARAALLQGVFLAVLGIGVVAATIYRVFVLNSPEAELMGVFGAIGLIVNLAAAAVLIPHRQGDANVRAIWLFSRNDALANIAVLIAAGLVLWTGTPWPDLLVAIVIAILFLESAWAIIADARRELERGQTR